MIEVQWRVVDRRPEQYGQGGRFHELAREIATQPEDKSVQVKGLGKSEINCVRTALQTHFGFALHVRRVDVPSAVFAQRGNPPEYCLWRGHSIPRERGR